jgi:DNA (cytosine-5)-methyltransferase 1
MGLDDCDVSAVDLFCGVGGLTYGLEQAGIDVEAGVDIDPGCEYPFTENNDADFIQDDVMELADERPDEVLGLFDEKANAKLLAGCAPCQPFSSLTNDLETREHDKWGSLKGLEKLVEYIEPELVVMENVYEIQAHPVYDNFVDTLQELNYSLNPPNDRNVYCPEYGIPQKRKRTVLLASKSGLIEMRSPTHSEDEYPTVKEKIDTLPNIEAGEVHDEDPLHRSQGMRELNMERIEISEPGGTWEDWIEEGREDLLADCHKEESGKTYKAPYSRMKADEPAPTITTQFYNYGSGRFGHYDTDQNRALSLREGAMLQTFPRDYSFIEDEDEVTVSKIGRWIGNAVPPKLAEVIGDSVIQHVEWVSRQSTVEDFLGGNHPIPE